MRGGKRTSDHAPLQVRTRGLSNAHRNPRGAGRNDRTGRCSRIYHGELDLEIRPFRAIFLSRVRMRHRRFKIEGKC